MNGDKDFQMAEEYDFSGAKRGTIIPPRPHATEIRLRIDTDLLEWWQAYLDAHGGGTVEDIVNDALRLYRASAESLHAHRQGV